METSHPKSVVSSSRRRVLSTSKVFRRELDDERSTLRLGFNLSFRLGKIRQKYHDPPKPLGLKIAKLSRLFGPLISKIEILLESPKTSLYQKTFYFKLYLVFLFYLTRKGKVTCNGKHRVKNNSKKIKSIFPLKKQQKTKNKKKLRF